MHALCLCRDRVLLCLCSPTLSGSSSDLQDPSACMHARAPYGVVYPRMHARAHHHGPASRPPFPVSTGKSLRSQPLPDAGPPLLLPDGCTVPVHKFIMALYAFKPVGQLPIRLRRPSPTTYPYACTHTVHQFTATVGGGTDFVIAKIPLCKTTG